MKILIITENVGKTAPGIVFERIIYGLACKNEVDVLTADYDPSIDLSNVSNVFMLNKKKPYPRLNKLFLILLGFNPLDCFFAWKGKRKISKDKIKDYDLVFSFLSFQHYIGLIIGLYLCREFRKKFAVYSVDAIPAPIGWLKYDRYYRGLQKMVAYYLSEADAFFSSNHQMLEYQLKIFKPKANLFSDVLYNPSFGDRKHLPQNNEKTKIFVYTGGIYGVRKADYLLKGFEKLVKIYPDSKLIFVGTQSKSLPLEELNSETLLKIEVHSFTKDLSHYYNYATALIDIDADLENDVFLSSKMTNYLLIDRIVISETGKNSPSRHMFKGIDSIIQCDHDSDKICEAMIKAIQVKKSVDFNDRLEVIKLFGLNNVAEELNVKLEQLVALN